MALRAASGSPPVKVTVDALAQALALACRLGPAPECRGVRVSPWVPEWESRLVTAGHGMETSEFALAAPCAKDS